MSGFVAVVNLNGAPVDHSLLEKLTTSLHFKGPDRSQIWVSGPVGLGHTLFRTTHEAKYEEQPISLDNEIWITGCIRVDAREELIDKLGIAHDIVPDRTPDSALVLYAYRKWGEACLGQLLGDYAFVIWDSRKQQLFCARDRFGMRQLYFSQVGDILIASNSMFCMHRHPAITKRLNAQAIGDFLLFGDHTWMDKAQTAFADIQSLLPAHYLLATERTLRTCCYWDLPTDIPLLRYRNEEEYVEHFLELYTKVIGDRIRTSQVVISLSGGMDSSSIAAISREIQQTTNQKFDLNAITVLYDSIFPSDERRHAESVYNHLGLPTHFLDGGSYPLMMPPVQTTRPLELYQPALWLDMERYARSMGRVMLTGDAGDNLLANSSILKAMKETGVFHTLSGLLHLRNLYGEYPSLGSGIRTGIKRLFNKEETSPTAYPKWINPEFESNYQLKQRWSEWNSWQPQIPNARYSQLNKILLRPEWNTDDVYYCSDFTLPEKRDPFLDARLVEFVAALPPLPWLFKKHLLRQSMVERLPPEIIMRPKTVLGDIHIPLVKQADFRNINDLSTVPYIEDFIDRDKLPIFDQASCQNSELYINLRPFLLKSWIEGLDS